MQGWWLAVLIPVLLIGARTRGIVGVGGGHVLVAGPLVLPAFLWALFRCGISVRAVLATCWRPFLGGALMAVACELVLRTTGDGLAGTVIAGGVALAVYLPMAFPMRKLLRRADPGGCGLPDQTRAA